MILVECIFFSMPSSAIQIHTTVKEYTIIGPLNGYSGGEVLVNCLFFSKRLGWVLEIFKIINGFFCIRFLCERVEVGVGSCLLSNYLLIICYHFGVV